MNVVIGHLSAVIFTVYYIMCTVVPPNVNNTFPASVYAQQALLLNELGWNTISESGEYLQMKW